MGALRWSGQGFGFLRHRDGHAPCLGIGRGGWLVALSSLLAQSWQLGHVHPRLFFWDVRTNCNSFSVVVRHALQHNKEW